jgi:hypothetical protein
MKRAGRLVSLSVVVLLTGGTAGAQGQEPVGDSYAEQGTPQPSAQGSSLAGTAGSAGVSARGPGNFQLGFADPSFTRDDPAGLREDLLDEAVSVNGRVAQVWINWSEAAPGAPSSNFDPTDPGSPEYSWGRYDRAVIEAAARGLRVTILIRSAPTWAEGPDRPSNATQGSWKPDPDALGEFATAVASRYSGDFGGLPRVRDYVAWNEPNLASFLTPTWGGKNGKRPDAVEHYRKMLNSFYDAVHAVRDSNRVIGGGTAPYGADPGVEGRIRPLQFWRELLCLEGKGSRKLRTEKCAEKVKLDIAAHHPINTSGGPRRSAIDRDDVSTPDVKHLIKVLRFAERKSTVLPKKRGRDLWANELWWESNPPDPARRNPSLRGQARFYVEAFYVLWSQGVSMVLPFQVRDEAFLGGTRRSTLQGGLYLVNGEPKPAAKGMRFPFVGDRANKRRVLLWGLAPDSGNVRIEIKKGKGFRTIERFRVRSGKVFTKRIKLKGKAVLRARLPDSRSMTWKVSG